VRVTRLYLRIWLTTALAVVLVTVLVGVVGRAYLEQERRERAQAVARNPVPPWFMRREWVLRDDTGRELGRVNEPPLRVPGQGWELRIDLAGGGQQVLTMTQRERGQDPLAGSSGSAPPRPPPDPTAMPWVRSPMGLLLTLLVLAAAVALGAYPISRRITQRLEALQRGVARWGDGDLSTRVAVRGEDEIAFLARQFNDSAARIETLVTAHKHLLANASHELRSPLARVRMAFELFEASPSDAVRAEIKRSMGELDQLIDEVLLASRLDAKAMEPYAPLPLDLTALLVEECARMNVALHAGEDVHHILGESKHLRRAVRNLLENARRYGGDVVVCSVQADAEAVTVRVEDGGPGVPQSEREAIFEPFYRAAGASERSGGVGLGLALVRSIAQRHMGSVRCTDRPAGAAGACFELSLPRVTERVDP
jgi:two-component system, OmpR family, sensor kinase